MSAGNTAVFAAVANATCGLKGNNVEVEGSLLFTQQLAKRQHTGLMNQGHKVGATKKNNQKYKFDIFRIF
jgi:hypothetical protein